MTERSCLACLHQHCGTSEAPCDECCRDEFRASAGPWQRPNWQPKQGSSPEPSFKPGDRVRIAVRGALFPATILAQGEMSGTWHFHRDRCLPHFCDSDLLSPLPASEDDVPRKDRVIVKVVTAKEFNEGYPFPHSKGEGEKSLRQGGTLANTGLSNISEGPCSAEDVLNDHAKPGETWLFCKD